MYTVVRFRRYVLFLVALLGCIVLIGISLGFLKNIKPNITSGEVVKKKYTPARTEVVLIPSVVTDGSTTSYDLFPFVYEYSDKWEITIRDYDEQTKQYLTATYRVTEQVYNEVQIGWQFEYVKDMEPNEPEYTRKRLQEESSFEQSHIPN